MARGREKSRNTCAPRPTRLETRRAPTCMTRAPGEMIERSISTPSMRAPAPIDGVRANVGVGYLRALAHHHRTDDHAGRDLGRPIDLDAALDPILAVRRWAELRGEEVQRQAVDLEQILGISPVPAPAFGQADVDLAAARPRVAAQARRVPPGRSEPVSQACRKAPGPNTPTPASPAAPARSAPAPHLRRSGARPTAGSGTAGSDRAMPAQRIDVGRERLVQQAVADVDDARGGSDQWKRRLASETSVSESLPYTA